MKKLDIRHAETKAVDERDHEKEMKKLDIKHDETRAAFKVAEQEAKVQVCEVYRCYLEESFIILIKVMKLEFEERKKLNTITENRFLGLHI